MISEYAESLAGRLGFDRALSQRVRQEVEDHLREAVAADSAGNPLEAERRAIANFGDPRAIAAQIAVASLAEQTRKIGMTVILVIASVFLAMKTRVLWYELTQWALCDDTKAISELVASIDRCAFWLSVVVGTAGWVIIGRLRSAAVFQEAYRRQLQRFFLACTIAALGLIAAVICDGVLTALRLSGWEWSVDFLVPILSMALEIACAAVLVFHIRGIVLRTASAAPLLGPVPSD